MRAIDIVLTAAALFSIGCKSMKKDAFTLPVLVSQEYKVTNSSANSISSPIPEQKPTIQVVVELSKGNKKAYIFYWDGSALRDLGPMATSETWQHNFLGEDASVTRTTMFMGREQEVIVLHHKPDTDTQLMIYSPNMSRDEFHEMLGKMRKK